MTEPAILPDPPYYAVVFTSLRTDVDEGYADTSRELFALVRQQPGYLGADTARNADGLGITVAYFRDEPAITGWRTNPTHTAARDEGRARWYTSYAIHVAKVERAYHWHR